MPGIETCFGIQWNSFYFYYAPNIMHYRNKNKNFVLFFISIHTNFQWIISDWSYLLKSEKDLCTIFCTTNENSIVNIWFTRAIWSLSVGIRSYDIMISLISYNFLYSPHLNSFSSAWSFRFRLHKTSSSQSSLLFFMQVKQQNNSGKNH